MATYAKISLGILIIALLSACSSGPGEKYVGLAKCISEKGTVMYGAYWCPHCQNQKRLFGDDAFKYITYVECDPRGYQGSPEKCDAAGVKSFPTWIFANEERSEGELTLEQLSEKTGCPLPQEDAATAPIVTPSKESPKP